MPRMRPVKKGSFGSHFDEVVKHFPEEASPRHKPRGDRKPSRDDGNVHDKLFEAAWRKARDKEGSARSSGASPSRAARRSSSHS
jgi:hypothetical protein